MASSKTKRAAQQYTWEGVEVRAYKSEGTAPFKDVTRQVLFDDPHLAAQWRYFEVAPGGHTTLERHRHVHAVMVIRGRGPAWWGTRCFPLRCTIWFMCHPLPGTSSVPLGRSRWAFYAWSTPSATDPSCPAQKIWSGSARTPRWLPLFGCRAFRANTRYSVFCCTG